MVRHRQNPVCASCHAQMDPLGFALENFDAVGRWRFADESGTVIDASGKFPNGMAFRGIEDFRTLLLNDREAFVTTLIEKLLTYSIGRGLEYRDAPSVRSVGRAAAAADDRWSAVILGIVKSRTFLAGSHQ